MIRNSALCGSFSSNQVTIAYGYSPSISTSGARLRFLIVVHTCSLVSADRAHLIHYLFKAETGGLLAWWELLECLHELRYICLSRNQHVGAIQHPVKVAVGGYKTSLVWVSTEVFDDRRSHRYKWLHPDPKGAR